MDDNKIFEPEDEWIPQSLPPATEEAPTRPKRQSKKKAAGPAAANGSDTFTTDQVGKVVELLFGDAKVITLSAERIGRMWELVIGGKLTLDHAADNDHDIVGYLDIASLKQTLPQLIKLL